MVQFSGRLFRQNGTKMFASILPSFVFAAWTFLQINPPNRPASVNSGLVSEQTRQGLLPNSRAAAERHPFSRMSQEREVQRARCEQRPLTGVAVSDSLLARARKTEHPTVASSAKPLDRSVHRR